MSNYRISALFLVYPSIAFIDQDFQKRRERKKMKIGQVFSHLAKKIYSFFQKAFLRFAYFIVDIYAMPWKGMCHQDLEAVGQQAHTIAQTI